MCLAQGIHCQHNLKLCQNTCFTGGTRCQYNLSEILLENKNVFRPRPKKGGKYILKRGLTDT